MKTFRIVRVEDIWQGMQDGETTILVSAIDNAHVREVVFNKARELGPSRVLVSDANGDLTEERTFGTPRAKGYAGDWS